MKFFNSIILTLSFSYFVPAKSMQHPCIPLQTNILHEVSPGLVSCLFCCALCYKMHEADQTLKQLKSNVCEKKKHKTPSMRRSSCVIAGTNAKKNN